MIDQIDQVLHDWLHISNIIIFFSGLISLYFVVRLFNIVRRRDTESYLSIGDRHKSSSGEGSIVKTRDTLFIFPDISGYTRFMAGKHFTSEKAQFIVFSLINSIIKASKKTLTLSKIDGDAVLLFTDADRYSKQKIGGTLADIYHAFSAEKDRLMSDKLCSCEECQHINILDLKIIVHRGNLSRFEFRGSIDHFGHELIILYRIVKNKVSTSRYILVTDAAKDLVELPDVKRPSRIKLQIDDIGNIGVNKYTLSEYTIGRWKNRPLVGDRYERIKHRLKCFLKASKDIFKGTAY